MIWRKNVLTVALLAGLVAGATVVRADVHINLESYLYNTGTSNWEYSYEIDNTTGTEYVYYMELAPVDMATIVDFPTGWGDTFGDTSIGGYVTWSATSTGVWVAPGDALSGFEIESPYSPGVDYSVWGAGVDDDGADGGSTQFISGYTDGPHVPEPATLLLFATGIAGLAAKRLRRED